MRNLVVRARSPLLSSVFLWGKQSVLLLAVTLGMVRPGTAADLRSERMIGPGVKCIMLTRGAGPWVIRIIETDGESGYVRPGAVFASERGLRAAPVSEQAAKVATETRYPIAGVNGDFFVKSPGPFAADPIGALVAGGEVISSPYPRSALLIGADGRYSLQRLRLAAWAARPDGVRRDVSGLNQPRAADDLVLYTPRFGLSSATNGQGTEAILTGIALPVHLNETYHARVTAVADRGDSPIPADGVVLSARGAAREFLRGLKAGDEVQFRLEFDPRVPADTDVVGGGPTLLRDGRVVVGDDPEGFKPDVVAGRAPRTAVGFNGRRLLFVTVDGRHPGVSAGMTLAELAALLRELGCTDAINLDGGGSTTAWVRGAVINQPSDGRERRVADSLFLFSTAPKGPPVRLIISPAEIAILAGASCSLTLAGAEDQFYNPVPPPSNPPAWQVPPDLGAIVGQEFRSSALQGLGGSGVPARGGASVPKVGRSSVTKPALLLAPAPDTVIPDPPNSRTPEPPNPRTPERLNPRLGILRVVAGKVSGSARLRIYARPPQLDVTPPAATVAPGASQGFAVRALDELGRPLIAAGLPVRWQCPPNLGQVGEDGVFRAARAPARGELTVELAGTRAVVPVTVGGETRLLDGFEEARWTGSTVPPTVKGSVALDETAPHEGRRCLRLEYDFTGERTTRAVYASAVLPVGQPVALRLWVRGDGGGAWLRARLRDSQHRAVIVDFSRDLGRLEDWRELTATLPVGVVGPLTLEALYLVEPNAQAQPRGVVQFDALAADYAPSPLSIPVATPAGLPTSPGIPGSR